MRYLIGFGSWAAADDGIGLRLAEHVARAGLERGFEAVAIAGDGMQLLTYLREDTEKIVLVDATDLGLTPGEYRLFRPEDVESTKHLDGLTSHEGDILKILGYAKALGYRLPPITIVGIQPENLGPGVELSPVLRERFDTYLRVTLAALGAGR